MFAFLMLFGKTAAKMVLMANSPSRVCVNVTLLFPVALCAASVSVNHVPPAVSDFLSRLWSVIQPLFKGPYCY